MLKRVKLLEAMTASARSRLPSDIAPHCWVGGFDEHIVVIITDDPAYSIHLRWHQKEILKQLYEEFARQTNKRWRKIHVRVSREPIRVDNSGDIRAVKSHHT